MPPPIFIGQRVLHFNSEADWLKWTGQVDSNEAITPSPATVIGKGDRTLTLQVIPANGREIVNKSAVRHVTDPDKTVNDREKRGYWDYSEESGAFWDMKIRLETLEKALDIVPESAKREQQRLADKKAREEAKAAQAKIAEENYKRQIEEAKKARQPAMA